MSVTFVLSALSRLEGSDEDGIHLLWTAPAAIGYSVDGFDIQRRKSQGGVKIECQTLTAGELSALHTGLRVAIRFGIVGIQQTACPQFPATPPDEPAPTRHLWPHGSHHKPDERPDDYGQPPGRQSQFIRPDVEIRPAAGPAAGIARIIVTQPRCLFYDIRFDRNHDFVRVEVGLPVVLAIALRDGKAVATALQSAAAGVQTVVFEGRGVDRVLLYAGRTASSMTVCADARLSPEQEQREWNGVPILAKNVHLPIRRVNGALASEADENALAASRLLSGEPFDATVFQDVAGVMNSAAANASDVSPMRFTIVTRERSEDPPIELRAWPYAFSLLTDAAWRRMLGFGFFDKDGLSPGTSYDYRITGSFRRREIDEPFFGFHTIPIGTALPRRFRLGPILLNTFRPSTVEVFPRVDDNALEAVGLKAISLAASGIFGASASITYSTPITRAILELIPSDDHALTFAAKTTEYFSGLTGTTFSGGVPNQRRVVLDFAEPIDTLVLTGRGVLCGIRLATTPPAGNPEDIVPRSIVLPGVRFEPTPAPPAPPFLGTVNLQEEVVAGDPAITTERPPQLIGFRLSWLPPPTTATPTVPWPQDLGAFPPFDVVKFAIERRRMDPPGPFEEIDKATAFFGSRGGRRRPPQIHPGMDLLALFPETALPEPPVPVFMEAEDVLLSASKNGPPPGSLHQYRIASVDAFGRRSAVPTLGSIVRLEKRTPPPQPVGPTAPLPPGIVRPSGVRARVLQELDADLTPSDRALLGTSVNAVVLEWAWTQAERERDPFATEFRVYFQPVPPDIVRGDLTGPAVVVGTLFEMHANLNQAIVADALHGRYLPAGSYPFKVASHTAGQTVTIQFERSEIDTTLQPGAGAFEAPLILSGAELRPGVWTERTAVCPITTDENYTFVFRDRFVLDADHPDVFAWTGVSAADEQVYIPDEMAGSQPNGGRPGNESSIAAAAAHARYLGRPIFTIPPPLPDVPEQVTDEPVAGSVAVVLNLPALLTDVTIPAGHQVVLERVSADALLGRMSAQPDDTIGARLPDGTTTTYVLANPDDQAALLSQIRTAEPARVEGRFVMDFLVRHLGALERVWQAALPAPVAFGPVSDTLAAKAERYIHRVRLVDRSGHVSSGGAIVPQFVRVASLRAPATPEFELPGSTTDVLTLSARVHDAFDLRWLIVFPLITDATETADVRTTEKPQLLRLPNRRDLYPDDGIRLRLADGTLLAPVAIDVDTGVVEVPDRLLTVLVTAGFGKRVSAWTLAMTRDGITSRIAGPRTAFTAPPPLTVPELTVTAGASVEVASWTLIPQQAQIALERSLDGGATWGRVSPLLPETITTFEVPHVNAERQYRLALRASHDRSATGAGVEPS